MPQQMIFRTYPLPRQPHHPYRYQFVKGGSQACIFALSEKIFGEWPKSGGSCRHERAENGVHCAMKVLPDDAANPA